MGDCLFCRIVKRDIQASVVCESENSLAFRDIHPRAPVHVLVIPKKHIESVLAVSAADAEAIVDIHRTIQEVARREGIDRSGFRVVVNTGADSGQAVGHLHYHVLGGRGLGWPPG